MRLHLIAACLLSCGVHTGLLLFVPAPSFRPLLIPDTPSDVELVVLDIPLPSAQPSPPLAPAATQPPSLPMVPTYEAQKISQPNAQQIDGTIEKMSAGLSLQLSMPQLAFPTQRHAEASSEPFLASLPDAAEVAAAILEPSSRLPGLPTGVDKQIGLGQVRLGAKQSPSRLGIPALDQKLVVPSLPAAPPVLSLALAAPQFGIQGPVAEREPLFRPSFPEVHVQTESKITLEFWVRPDGMVSRVLPERKGDTALETAAIRYLEGWRFTPLPRHEPQEEQWGTITVRFLPPQH